ncbi:MAG: hypothetical protein KC502_23710 [Myxococcales bacterium]|nr:hypothetical protein [Myxococcales bacterium]
MTARITLALATLLAAVFAGACGALPNYVGEQSTDQGVVDYSAMFGASFTDSAFVSHAMPNKLLRRVLISPSVAMPDSRTSSTPTSTNAVSSAGASVLVALLGQWGSDVIAPAALRPMLKRACKDPCDLNNATWLEQALWLASAAPNPSDALRRPTAALPVTTLRTHWKSVSAAVLWNATKRQFEVLPTHLAKGRSRCSGMKLSIPVNEFASEVVDVRSGRILLRVDTAKSVEQSGFNARWQIQVRRSQGVYRSRVRNVYCATIPANWRAELVWRIARARAAHAAQLRALVAKGLQPLREGSQSTKRPRPAPLTTGHQP